MLSRTMWARIAVGALLASVLGSVLAQDAEPPRRGYSRFFNVDAMIDSYARILARKYDLTEEQDVFTQEYLRMKAHEFLDKHQDKLFELMDRLIEVRGGSEIDQQELIGWGKRALPLYEEAKLLIIEGNNEWREILTEEQRQVHDEDLKMMYQSFTRTEDQLHRMVRGQMTVEELRRGPRARHAAPNRPDPGADATPPGDGMTSGVTGQQPDGTPVVREVPTPIARPDTGRRARPRGPVPMSPTPSTSSKLDRSEILRRVAAAKGEAEFESGWEAYVREFIEKYKLTDGQAQRAKLILKDCQEQARQYMQRHKAELEQLDKKKEALTESKDKLKALTELSQRRAKLLEPIGRIFEKRLKPRLEKLLTRAQRQAAEQAAKGKPAPSGNKEQPVPKPPKPGHSPGEPGS